MHGPKMVLRAGTLARRMPDRFWINRSIGSCCARGAMIRCLGTRAADIEVKSFPACGSTPTRPYAGTSPKCWQCYRRESPRPSTRHSSTA